MNDISKLSLDFITIGAIREGRADKPTLFEEKLSFYRDADGSPVQ